MKKVLPILCITALFTLSGCDLIFNRGGKSDKPGESSELLPSQDNPSQQNPSQNPSEPGPSTPVGKSHLAMAIEAMNAFNYHMSYSVCLFAEDIPDEYQDIYGDLFNDEIGPYLFDYDYPKVHYQDGDIEYYWSIDNWYSDPTDFEHLTKYYKDSDGVWRTEPYSIADEKNQIKFFDQFTHLESDFEPVPGEEDVYCLTTAKLEEYGFHSLYLGVIVGDYGLEKITVNGTVESNQMDLGLFVATVNTDLHADLTQFGEINLTLPNAY